ncbi:MAG: pantoate--beta-alanine ligase [Bacteroidetes bacterium]|nr:pantoate--beta-alanine ligase [Bacteroidota bacterium]
MILLKTAADLTFFLSAKKAQGLQTGFVPTMGALHEGHLRLAEHSKKNNNITVVSIFVNPTQFNDPQDFTRYPVTLENDIYLLEKTGCDILFLPSVPEIYPSGMQLTQPYDLGYLETLLEGKYRPGHFQGVCQVVHRLLELVQPANLYLGQKDYQQCMVIRQLIHLTALPVQLEIVPTKREPSGLAMSSRNLRLSENEKKAAAVIYQCLVTIQAGLKPGSLDSLVTEATAAILAAGFDKIDYVSIADAATLLPVTAWDGQSKLVALVAAFISGVRLIDNLTLN